MSLKIMPIDIHTFNAAVRLVMLFMKEHRGLTVHRIEAENILKQKGNKVYVLVVNHEVRGVYVFEDIQDVYSIKVFILDPLVRQKKTGYMLWKHMQEKLKNKPAIIGVVENNKSVKSLIEKRGVYLGTYLAEDGDTLSFYNLSFKQKDNK